MLPSDPNPVTQTAIDGKIWAGGKMSALYFPCSTIQARSLRISTRWKSRVVSPEVSEKGKGKVAPVRR